MKIGVSMGFKTNVRKKLEKFVGNYGYQMVKNPDLNELSIIVDDNTWPFNEAEFNNRDKESYTLGWVIPPLGPGAGGHRTIFRTIDNFSKQGIRSEIFIYGPVGELSSEELRKMVLDFYQVDLGENEIYGSTRYLHYVDGIVATSWQTAYFARNYNNCKTKFYFVQDFEPYFYGRDALYYFAENTYKLGFYGVTAGRWLEKKLRDDYGMQTIGFDFSYDKEVYCIRENVKKPEDGKKHIFFYARPSTGRRAFEMGALAFDKLAKLRDDFVVEFAGQELRGYDLRFPYNDHGIVSPEELSKIYSMCDICVVMSLTNMSLLPYEIMASGSVVMINSGANNDWAVNESNSIVVDMDPANIADTLDKYLSDEKALDEMRRKGIESLPSATWYDTSVQVADFIREKIKENL